MSRPSSLALCRVGRITACTRVRSSLRCGARPRSQGAGSAHSPAGCVACTRNVRRKTAPTGSEEPASVPAKRRMNMGEVLNMSSENKKTILLVEDELIIAMSEKMSLEKHGYSVSTVTTGEEAIETVKSTPKIDLILIDIDLGKGIDGTKAAEAILKDHDIPVVFLSSHTEPEIVEKTEKITSYGYVVKSSSITVLDASIKMAFKLFEEKQKVHQKQMELEATNKEMEAANEELIKMQKLHHETEEFGKIGGWESDIENDTDTWTNGTFNIFEIDPKKGVPKLSDALQFIFPPFRQMAYEAITKSIENGEPYDQEWKIITEKGNIRWLHSIAKSYQVQGKIKKVLGSFQDITERKQAEKSLRETYTIINKSPSVAITWRNSAGWPVEFVTGNVEKIFGYTVEELKSGKVPYAQCVHPGDLERVAGEVCQFSSEEGRSEFVHKPYRIVTKEGIEKIIDDKKSIVRDEKGNVTHYQGILTDITSKQLAEDEIKKQLSEKELLLNVVYHRIKNNIASIEGFLSLQLAATTNNDVISALQDALTRVQSMRIIYNKLLIGKDYQEVSVKEYTESLIDAIAVVFSESETVIIEKQIADFNLNTNKLFPIGIIINELLTNVYKNAFKGRDGGQVSIILDKTENHVNLTIKDNGIGIDERVVENKSPGFGLTIVKMLAVQLKGTYVIENDNGTKSVLKFDI